MSVLSLSLRSSSLPSNGRQTSSRRRSPCGDGGGGGALRFHPSETASAARSSENKNEAKLGAAGVAIFNSSNAVVFETSEPLELSNEVAELEVAELSNE